MENEFVDFGFVFAMSMEAGGLVDLLEGRVTTRGNGRIFHRGKLHNTQIAIVESGIGQVKAASATQALLEIFCPAFVVSAGYAGGLFSDFKRFSVYRPELLLRKSDGATLDISNNIVQDAKKFAGQNLIADNNIVTKNRCTLVTVDQPVESPEEKLLLGKTSGAGLVDMETFAVADVCKNWQGRSWRNEITTDNPKNNTKNNSNNNKNNENAENNKNSENDRNNNDGVNFSALRIVLDAVDDELPKEVKRIIQSYERSAARLIGTTIGSFFKRPSIVFDLYSLKERALQATDILAKYITTNIIDSQEGEIRN
ncbi:MAG: hypothetical protein LBP59_04490 [Planctomycetaceae bacterium]|jgi:adenosylhomocysteine nucleosidase|nr:hypothetical protein [Planctomycetaceae bacterium]